MNTNNNIQAHGIGRRKQAVAQVILIKGTGKLTINKKKNYQYFQNNLTYKQKINLPLLITGQPNTYDFCIKTKGGGLSGQTDAIMLAISRALIKLNSENRKKLKKIGLLTCDSRIKERKKAGLKKARKAAQFSKR